MLSVQENYYEILQVERTATEQEIKKAYRKLSKILHPDISKAPNAHELFSDLERAYSVLMDEENRRKYNEFLAREELKHNQKVEAMDTAWLSLFKRKSGLQRPFDGMDLKITAFFTPEDLYKGRDIIAHYKRKQQCPTCMGAKKVRLPSLQVCTVCAGRKTVQKSTKTMFGQLSKRETCEHCLGCGYEIHDCLKCEGSGIVERDATASFQVPRNITHRSVVSVTGQGHLGLNGGRNGNLIVTMLLEKNDRYTIDIDGNIYENVYVDAMDFYDGKKQEVEMPSGEKVTLILPENSQPGYRIKFPNEGMQPSKSMPRGDLIFVFQATLPNLTEAVLQAISERYQKESAAYE